MIIEKTSWLLEGLLRKAAQRLATKNEVSDPVSVRLDDFTIHFAEWFYPYHFLSRENMYPLFEFDQDGVPVKMHVQKIDERSPLAPAYWGLILTNEYLRDRSAEMYLEQAVKCANYLINAATDFRATRVIFRNKPYEKFQTADKWYAGISQGLAVSLLVRLYKFTGETSFRDQAEAFARSMEIPVKEGGVVSLTQFGNPWIEEYPGRNTSHVLNGFMFSLIAISELEAVSDYRWKFAEYTSRSLHTSLLESFPLYMKGPFLKYDLLHEDFCNPHYVGLHALLFYHLYKMTALEIYEQHFQLLFKKTWWSVYFMSYGLKKSDFYVELAKLRSPLF